MLSKVKTQEFTALYEDFSDSYLSSERGRKHAAKYAEGREQAKRNFDEISKARQSGEEITDLVLLKLLPHNDTAPHREEGAWIHVAPSITKDIRSWYESTGWTKSEDWPKVAEAIFEFVNRCNRDPGQLDDAVEQFTGLPYSRGFQSGMLTPILNALRPNDYTLINSKSLKVLNYFLDTKLGASLTEYPEANTAATALVSDIEHVLDRSKSLDLPHADLLDMFSHWLVAIREYEFGKQPVTVNGNGTSGLEEPFNQIFESYEQADKAFDLIAWAARRLGMKGPGDPLEAFTYRRYKGKHAIHFSFGRWLILGFAGRGGTLEEIHIALFTGSVDFEPLDQGTFSRDGDEPSVTLYTFSASDAFPLDEDTQSVFEETLRFVHGKFEGWVRSPYWKASLSVIADAALDPSARQGLLTEGLPRNVTVTADEEEELEGLEIQPEYSIEMCVHDTGLEQSQLERWVRAIHRKGQGILYGPPGTGKTYIAEKLAAHLVSSGDGISELVQFHPSYSYEDFIQGIRPQPGEDGSLNYPIVAGRFVEFCEIAGSRTGICVLIVDEINRANLSRVFGELMYLLEYRAAEVPLAAGGAFAIPENVRIIGTMNTADRSIALVDHALRRRFAFLSLYPDFNILRHYHTQRRTGFSPEPVIRVLERLNHHINDLNYSVGITYFLRNDIKEHLEDVWRMEIEPYLEEYFFDRPEKVEEFRWSRISTEVVGGRSN